MIDYNDYVLTPDELSALYDFNERKGVRRYIKENGVAPEDSTVYRTATEDELEKFKRACYARKMVMSEENPYAALKAVEGDISGFLYETAFETLDYATALDFFESRYKATEEGAGCSSIHKGNFYGRNLDWYYNMESEVIVRTLAHNGLHATLGVAGACPLFTKDVLDAGINSGKFIEMYNMLPFFIVDGINDAGLVANLNVVPTGDKGITTGTIPTENIVAKVCYAMLTRYVLDHFSTAEEAVEYIGKHISLYAPNSDAMKQEAHLMIADSAHTYIIETCDNEYNPILVDEHPFMTNFYIKDVVWDEDGHVNYLGSNITPYGAGLERYNTMVDAYEAIDSDESMMSLMGDIMKYTNAYLNPRESFWYSEFVADEATVEAISTDICKQALWDYVQDLLSDKKLGDHLQNRSRVGYGSGSWESSHTSVYNIEERKLTIRAKEFQNDLVFTL